MRIVVLDSALARCTAAVVADGAVLASRTETRAQGHEAILPVMLRDAIREAGGTLDLVAVTVGPGSFTGIRAGLALAHGLGLALGVPVIGVTVGEAIGDTLPHLGRRALWIVTGSRRGHFFLEHDGAVDSHALDAPPVPSGAVAIAGPAANQIAASLAARGANVMLTDARFALPRHIALVAERRHLGELPARPAQPLYVDPPYAKRPAAGLRPAPLPAEGR